MEALASAVHFDDGVLWVVGMAVDSGGDALVAVSAVGGRVRGGRFESADAAP
jgi:hypothetical protein